MAATTRHDEESVAQAGGDYIREPPSTGEKCVVCNGWGRGCEWLLFLLLLLLLGNIV